MTHLLTSAILNLKKLTLKNYMITMLITLFSTSVLAQQPVIQITSENFINYDELLISKHKKYPGGIDEEELKVQSQLVIPVSKMVEGAAEAEEVNSHD